MAGHVFISYATSDGEIAGRVCAAIEQRGVRCWMAPRDVEPGSDYGASLLDAINGAAAVVLVLSAESNTSPHVRREIERAANRDLTIVPFVVKKVELSKSLEFFISTHHWLNATVGPAEEHIRKLVEAVERLVLRDPAGTRSEPRRSPTGRRETVGSMVGDYRITRALGEGVIGAAYRAEHRLTSQVVELVVVESLRDRGVEFRGRFSDEIQVQSRLRHPAIARLYNCFEYGDSYCVAYEYMEGAVLSDGTHVRSLTDLIKRGPVPEARLADIFFQVLGALGYAHKSGVLHLQLKPSRVLFDESGAPRVVGFGTAWLAGGDPEASANHRLVFTPAYVSPEQARGERVTRTADIYLLGCMLYEATTGRPPFSAADPKELIRAHLERQPTSPRQLNTAVSERLEQAILKAMHKKPQDRFQTCEEFAAALGYGEKESLLQPVSVVVPSLVGKSREVAQGLVICLGLQLDVEQEEYSDSAAAGGVLAQRPVSGSEVAVGSVVFVRLSRGRRTTRPDESRARPESTPHVPRPTKPKRKTGWIVAGALVGTAVIVLVAVRANGKRAGGVRPVIGEERGVARGRFYAHEDDLATNTTTNYEVYSIPYGGGSASATIGYDAGSQKAILAGVGDYADLVMRPKDAPAIAPSHDFTFSYDVSIRGEYTGMIYLGDLQGNRIGKWLRFGLDTYGHVALVHVIVNGVSRDICSRPTAVSAGRLKVARTGSLYEFSLNGSQVWAGAIPELDGVSLCVGANARISSGSGTTAEIGVDNWFQAQAF